MAERCSNTLWKMRRLLDSKVISQLSTIPFLSNTLGGLTSPLDTYLPTSLNLACLGSEAAFVIGERRSLYKQLGCLTVPRSEDIVAHIERLRERGEAPEDAKILYATLVQTLRMEGKAPDLYDNHVILWTEGGFHKPNEVLVGRGYHKIFREAVPQVIGRSGYLKSARNLGAHSIPEPHHWRRLLCWFSNKWGGANPIPHNERERLRQVYATLPVPPEGISENEHFLLGTNGRLYSQAEAVKGNLLINDDPRLASELEARQSAVAFADLSEPGSLGFFVKAGVENLTAVRRLDGTYVGESVATGGRGRC